MINFFLGVFFTAVIVYFVGAFFGAGRDLDFNGKMNLFLILLGVTFVLAIMGRAGL